MDFWLENEDSLPGEDEESFISKPLVRTGQSIVTMMYQRCDTETEARKNVIYPLTSFCPNRPERPGIYLSG